MIFEMLRAVAWWAAQVVVVVALLAALVYPAVRAARGKRPPQRWKATVQTAQSYKGDYYESYKKVPVRGEVSVRVSRPGEFLTIGTVKTDADDFEDRLNGLVASAEDRAAALNAAEESLR